MARVGYGLAKIVLLALPLERMIEGTLVATPQSQSLISAWMGCLGFNLQLYFLLSGVVDLWLGGRKMVGKPCTEWFDDPFNAGGFSDFWRGWNAGLMRIFARGDEDSDAGARKRLFFHAALSAGVVVISVMIWRGVSAATGVWCAVQGGLLALEWWRGGRSVFMPLPLPIRAALTVAVVGLSNILLYQPSLPAAWVEMRHLFESPPETVYSLMLDERVAAPWLKLILSMAMLLAVAAPLVRWMLQKSAVIHSIVGILMGILAVGMLVKEMEPDPAHALRSWVRHVLQKPLALALQEGNGRVFVGKDGWLFSRKELDRLTRERTASAEGEALLAFAGRLKSAGVPLLVVVTPDKAAIYPQQILPAKYRKPVQPPGYGAALERLRGAGAEVLDGADALWKLREQEKLAFFKRDSHWTPEGMKEVALATAKLIRQKWPQVAVDETPLIRAAIFSRQDAGDLARELDDWAPGSLWGEETAEIISIQGLEPSARSPILLLGNGLNEVFHDAALSFGNPEGKPEHAGFSTQLAALLGRPLDVRTADDGAGAQAFAAWNSLASEKKLVICVAGAGDL